VRDNVVKYVKNLTKVMKPDGTNFSRKVSRRFQLLFTELEIESSLPVVVERYRVPAIEKRSIFRPCVSPLPPSVWLKSLEKEMASAAKHETSFLSSSMYWTRLGLVEFQKSVGSVAEIADEAVAGSDDDDGEEDGLLGAKDAARWSAISHACHSVAMAIMNERWDFFEFTVRRGRDAANTLAETLEAESIPLG
jgi:hypothetical protein